MTKQLDETAQYLREKVLAGHYGADQKLTELSLAEDLSVSRTLVRLALSELEKEGLVYRNPNRGFRVRTFKLDEITDAILVRGELEGMAARLCAEQGIDEQSRRTLRKILDNTRDLLQQGLSTIESRARWIDLNSSFHASLVAACGNSPLSDMIDQLSSMPLASPRALVFDQSDIKSSFQRLQNAHNDHQIAFEAIEARQGSRAERTMREHALKSAQNKSASFAAMSNAEQSPSLPGLALVKA